MPISVWWTDHTGRFRHHPSASPAIIVRKVVGQHLFLNIIPGISRIEPTGKFGVIGAWVASTQWFCVLLCLAVNWELGGLPSYGFNRSGWVVHCLWTANSLSGHTCSPLIRTRPCQVWRPILQPLYRLDCGIVGDHHYCPFLLACALSCGCSITKLYTCCCRGCVCASNFILASKCPQMVQRTSNEPQSLAWALLICVHFNLQNWFQ